MITCDKCGGGHLTFEEKAACKSWAETTQATPLAAPEPEPTAQDLAEWLSRAELYRDKQIYFVLPVEDSINLIRLAQRLAAELHKKHDMLHDVHLALVAAGAPARDGDLPLMPDGQIRKLGAHIERLAGRVALVEETLSRAHECFRVEIENLGADVKREAARAAALEAQMATARDLLVCQWTKLGCRRTQELIHECRGCKPCELYRATDPSCGLDAARAGGGGE